MAADPLIYVLDMLVFIGIFSLLAISLNLEYGFTGLGNFGKVAFFMAGAYTYALMIETGAPILVSLLGGATVAGLLGGLVSLPALRLREDYLAIVTLSFGEILRLFVKAQEGFTGGVHGIQVPAAFTAFVASPRLFGLANVVLVYLVAGVAFLFVQALINTPYGRVLRAIREDDVAVQVLGKNPVLYKVQVLVAGSFLAGLAGGAFAQYMRFIDPYMFLPLVTFYVWIALILGGPANNWGAVLGALVVEIFNRGTRIAKDYLVLPVDPNNLQFIMFGVLIILLLLYRPQGILGESRLRTPAFRRWEHGAADR